MKKGLLILVALITIAAVALQLKPAKKAVDMVAAVVETPGLVNKDSLTIATRVNAPKDYKRVNYPKGSFEDYLRNYTLKPFESKIINYDNTEYF
ncbi:hypothetical protein HNV08_12515 [Winogradskyella eckloniae]|uniref:DUF4846 domain-containing protein n=1 Tax=Winogradskyella eckloniae TaxID=1089306 RepID=UPI001564E344|nr:DUF4846 domain-containing protein [Winogradskyella eckloniae]NRD20871.1 hypothetical protein [Winogradskyella eckloniae]